MSSATITTANTVTTSTQNPNQPQQKQTAKEVIAANVQALIEQLEQGHSEGLTAYLTAMGRFHNYSFGNILEIARQKPDATRVAGLYAWNQLGRNVRKGEHGNRADDDHYILRLIGQVITVPSNPADHRHLTLPQLRQITADSGRVGPGSFTQSRSQDRT